MISNMNTDVIKELNLKPVQSSLSKKLDKNSKLKNFEDTFNKRLNNNLENKKEEKVDSHEEKVDKNYKKDNDKNDYNKKLDKLKEKLDKLSKKVDNKDEKDVNKEDVNNTIDELMIMLNELMYQLESEDNTLNIPKDESSINIVSDDKNSFLVDTLNTKKSNLGSELKEIIKMLQNAKGDEELIDLNSIKSIIDNLEETITKNVKNQHEPEKQEFKTNVINELKIALSNTSKNKEITNNAYKESDVVEEKNINAGIFKVDTENKSSNSSDAFKGNDGSNKNSTSSEDNTIKKEESFLDSLVNDKNKNAINRFMPGTVSKINTFEAALAKTSESAQSVNKVNVVDGIVKNIKFMQTNNLKELTVSMNPKDLGNMIIKISVEDGKLSAKIIAEKKETFELINSNATDVKNALGTINDRVQEVSVNIQFGDATAYEQFKEGQQYQGNEGRHTNSSDNVIQDETAQAGNVEEELYGDSVVNMLV